MVAISTLALKTIENCGRVVWPRHRIAKWAPLEVEAKWQLANRWPHISRAIIPLDVV